MERQHPYKSRARGGEAAGEGRAKTGQGCRYWVGLRSARLTATRQRGCTPLSWLSCVVGGYAREEWRLSRATASSESSRVVPPASRASWIYVLRKRQENDVFIFYYRPLSLSIAPVSCTSTCLSLRAGTSDIYPHTPQGYTGTGQGARADANYKYQPRPPLKKTSTATTSRGCEGCAAVDAFSLEDSILEWGAEEKRNGSLRAL